jgi:hypothetical protein
MHLISITVLFMIFICSFSISDSFMLDAFHLYTSIFQNCTYHDLELDGLPRRRGGLGRYHYDFVPHPQVVPRSRCISRSTQSCRRRYRFIRVPLRCSCASCSINGWMEAIGRNGEGGGGGSGTRQRFDVAGWIGMYVPLSLSFPNTHTHTQSLPSHLVRNDLSQQEHAAVHPQFQNTPGKYAVAEHLSDRRVRPFARPRVLLQELRYRVRLRCRNHRGVAPRHLPLVPNMRQRQDRRQKTKGRTHVRIKGMCTPY